MSERRHTGWLMLARMLALGVAVIVVGDLSIRLAPQGTNVASWWPAAGLAVVAGVRGGRRELGAVVAVTWVAGVIANLSGGREVGVALLFALANAVEVLIVCSAILAWNPQRRMQSFRALLLVGASTLLGAVAAGLIAGVTVAGLLAGGVWVTFKAVAASHLSATLLFLPFCLEEERPRRRPARYERLCTGSLLVATTLFVFSPNQNLPLVFLLLPLLVITAMRQSLRANAVQMILCTITATAACAAGWGPLILAVEAAQVPPESTGTILQALIASAAIMVLALHIAVETREAALAGATRARRHLEAVIESARSTAIIQCDLNGVIEVFNQGAVNMLGYQEEDVVGLHTFAFFHLPEEIEARAAELGVAPGIEAFVHRVRTGEVTSERRDWTMITVDGTRRLVSLVVNRVEEADGTPIGFLGIAEDVGSQRRVEQLLVNALDHERELAAQLRSADTLKSEFVSSVSHELRTPMTSVLGYTELLADEYAEVLDADGLAIVRRIQSGGRRLLHLVDDLLTLSRIESGTLALAELPFDLREAVRAAALVLEPLVAERVLDLSLDLPANPVIAGGDQVEMERVFINLLSNAIKFTPSRGRVRVGMTVHAEAVTVEVSDTGSGIPAADLERIFTRFHRAGNATASAAPGTGLGLAIVAGIVERHHGTITVRSVLGEGSTFALSLPLGAAVRDPEPVRSSAQH